MLPHHSAGKGVALTAIRPYWRACSEFSEPPTVEETLLRAFTKGTRQHQDVAAAIFRPNVLETCEMLRDITLPEVPEETRIWKCEEPTNELARAVWARVNISALLLKTQKGYTKRKEQFLRYRVMLFQNNHFEGSFGPLPRVQLDDDRDRITITKETYDVHPTPLQTLETEFPGFGWRMETVEIRTSGLFYNPLRAEPETHQIYFAALTIMHQCRECATDAAYFYFAAFMDLFAFGLGAQQMDDDFLTTKRSNTLLSAYELYYPHPTRAFTCWDLPDLFSVLCQIPLAGEQRTPNPGPETYLQKSLPFCCQRRTLVKRFVKDLERQPGIAALMSKLFWCMMGNMYPGTTKDFDMERLLRARRLADDKHALIEAFQREQFRPSGDCEEFHQENFKGCKVIILAFRLWIYAMTYHNSHYAEYASQYVDWTGFITSVIAAQEEMCAADIFKRDVFEDVRKMSPAKNVDVYRYRKLTKVNFVLKYLHETLEKNVFCELDAWRRDKETLLDPHFTVQKIEGTPIYDIYTDQLSAIEFCDLKIEQLGERIPPKIKGNILNTMLMVPSADRMSPTVMSMLRLPQFGGVSRNAILTLLGMIDVYKAGAKPRKVREFTGFVESTLELKILCWYATVVSILNSIKFLPLDVHSVRSIRRAFVEEKYKLEPGQTLEPNVYEVFLTVCCRKVVIPEGAKDFKHKNIYYDAVVGRLMCDKTVKSTDEDPDFRKKIRNMRKDFSAIPCTKSPVLRVNLYGKQLVYGSSFDKTNVYMHCPRCGTFHLYEWVNWSGSPDGRYRCGACRAAEPGQMTYYSCTHCQKSLTAATAKQYTLRIMCTDEIFKYVYYCKTHYSSAKNYKWTFFEGEIRRRVTKKAIKKSRYNG